MAVQQLDHLLPHAVQVRSHLDQHLGRHALPLAEQSQQDVLGTDVLMAELVRLPQRQLEHLLGPRRERDVPGRRPLPPADDLLHLPADRLQADSQRLQRPGRDALALVDQAEQQMLGADVGVVKHPGLFLGQDHDPPGPVGKPLKHVPTQFRRGRPRSGRCG